MSGGNWKEMFNAACEGELDLLKYHVQAGVDVNYAHPEFLSTPLVAAILAGQELAALYLIEHGASIDLGSEFDGVTPVQAARKAGLVRLEDKLCELGAQRPAEVRGPASWLRRLFYRGAA